MRRLLANRGLIVVQEARDQRWGGFLAVFAKAVRYSTHDQGGEDTWCRRLASNGVVSSQCLPKRSDGIHMTRGQGTKLCACWLAVSLLNFIFW